MSSAHYQWIHHDGCEVCEGLAGIHPSRPKRPHRHCVCTILTIDPSSMPGWCVLDEPLLLDLEPGDHDVDYDEETDTITRAVWEIVFTVLCRDLSVITGSYRYDDPDLELTADVASTDVEDHNGWWDAFFDSAARVAFEYADSACPSCEQELFPGSGEID